MAWSYAELRNHGSELRQSYAELRGSAALGHSRATLELRQSYAPLGPEFQPGIQSILFGPARPPMPQNPRHSPLQPMQDRRTCAQCTFLRVWVWQCEDQHGLRKQTLDAECRAQRLRSEQNIRFHRKPYLTRPYHKQPSTIPYHYRFG